MINHQYSQKYRWVPLPAGTLYFLKQLSKQWWSVNSIDHHCPSVQIWYLNRPMSNTRNQSEEFHEWELFVPDRRPRVRHLESQSGTPKGCRTDGPTPENLNRNPWDGWSWRSGSSASRKRVGGAKNQKSRMILYCKLAWPHPWYCFVAIVGPGSHVQAATISVRIWFRGQVVIATLYSWRPGIEPHTRVFFIVGKTK